MCCILLNLSVAELATNETLEREDGVGGVDDGLPLRWQTDETLPVLRERDDRRCCPRTLRVLNHLRRLALHNGDAGICCSKVDTDDGAYMRTSARHEKQRGYRVPANNSPLTLEFMFLAIIDRGRPYVHVSNFALVQRCSKEAHRIVAGAGSSKTKGTSSSEHGGRGKRKGDAASVSAL